MEIKKFNQINENSEYELKAIEAGYKVGDFVYNHKMGKRQQIVKTSSEVMKDNKDIYCTIAAIGQWPENFTKIKDKESNRNEYVKFSREMRIKKIIDEILKEDMTKDELKEFLIKYIDTEYDG